VLAAERQIRLKECNLVEGFQAYIRWGQPFTSLRIRSTRAIAVMPSAIGQVSIPPWTRYVLRGFSTSRAKLKPRDSVGEVERLISIAISTVPPRSNTRSTSAPSSVR
jgi:hypothetical protein